MAWALPLPVSSQQPGCRLGFAQWLTRVPGHVPPAAWGPGGSLSWCQLRALHWAPPARARQGSGSGLMCPACSAQGGPQGPVPPGGHFPSLLPHVSQLPGCDRASGQGTGLLVAGSHLRGGPTRQGFGRGWGAGLSPLRAASLGGGRRLWHLREGRCVLGVQSPGGPLGRGEKGCLGGISVPLLVLQVCGPGSASSCSLSSRVASRSLQNPLPLRTVGERSAGPGGGA